MQNTVDPFQIQNKKKNKTTKHEIRKNKLHNAQNIYAKNT